MDTYAENRDQVSQNVNELSKKLLEGWTLMSDSCPSSNCNVPLVSNKDDHIYCISCGSYCVKTSDGVIVVKRDKSPVKAASPAAAPAQPSPQPVVAAASPPRSIQNEASIKSVGSNKSPSAKKSDSDSQKIAQKLLQGWTLLNEVCPNPACLIPLLRNREGQMFCVSCENWVITEEEFDPSRHKIVNTANGSASPDLSHKSPTALSSSQVTGAEERIAATAAIKEEQQQTRERLEELEKRASREAVRRSSQEITRRISQEVLAEPNPRPSTSPASTLPTATAVSATHTSSSTQEILWAKIESAKQKLAVTSDIAEITALGNCIYECSRALESLKKL